MLALASKSPARSALLANAGLRFDIAPAEIEEREIERMALADGASQRDVALTLAAAKAVEVSRLRPVDTVIGADQTLEFSGSGLHKPADPREARMQLLRLRGQTHSLHAAVSIARGSTILWSHVDTAHLTMRAFDEAELDHILALEGAAVSDSVGGYRLEGPSVRLFERVEGDYFTILGLPLLPLLGALRDLAPDSLED